MINIKVGEEVDNDAMWNAVTQLYLNGNLTAQQADRLEVMYGLTEPATQPTPLPTSTVIQNLPFGGN